MLTCENITFEQMFCNFAYFTNIIKIMQYVIL